MSGRVGRGGGKSKIDVIPPVEFGDIVSDPDAVEPFLVS